MPQTSSLEAAAAAYRASSEEYRNTFVLKHLSELCEKTAKQIGIYENTKPFDFHRQIASNQGDGALNDACRSEYPGGIAAAVRVLVRFEPSPDILLISYVAVIRTKSNREVIAIIDKAGRLKREVSESFPDDPRHINLLMSLALQELAALQDKAAAELKKRS